MIEIALPQSVGDFRDRNVQLRQPLFIDLDTDLLLASADDFHGGDPVGCLKTLLDVLIRQIAQASETEISMELQSHDGIVRRVEAQNNRLVGVLGEIDQVELLAGVHAGHVHTGVPAKLEHNF